MDKRDDFNPYYGIEEVQFRFYTTKDVRALSVKEITNVETFDTLNHPTVGGLYDQALGPSDEHDVCFTCNQPSLHCPGHMGHMELAMPVFNPLLFMTMLQTLRATCFTCHRLNVDPIACTLFLAESQLLEAGLVAEAAMLSYRFSEEDRSEDRSQHKQLIEETAKQCLQGKAREQDKNSHSYKNVEAVRQSISSIFTKVQMRKNKKCAHCLAKRKTLRHEDRSKIFLVGTLADAPKETGKTKVTNNQTGDDPEDDGDDEEEGDNSDTEEPARKRSRPDVIKSKQKGSSVSNISMITPLKLRDHFRKVWSADGVVLQEVYPVLKHSGLEFPTDIFFLEAIPVPPTKFRPISEMHDQKYEHSQTSNLLAILKDNSLVRDILWEMEKSSADTQVGPGSFSRELNIIPGKTLYEKLSAALARLQMMINRFHDSEADKSLTQDSKKNIGIKQVLEKKSGLFRKHMMGKRVNFAARSVISPDPNINTNEIGIPLVFAKVLTYPQPVTPWNVHELRQAVINGPSIYPGATHIVEENGRVTLLKGNQPIQRQALANSLLTPSQVDVSKPINGTKKVLRHLKNGDVLLLNRQPTLHRPSIQAHKARVLSGEKTLRLHYANCKAYNADFDGDEMNAHFPQNEIARAEAYNIVSTDFQYLVPKDGTPLAGLIQDHMVSGVTLTIRGRFFSRSDYCRLVYGALVDCPGRLKLLPPAILKPHPLWSGKQVLSTVVLNIIPADKPALSLIGKAKIPEKVWVKAGVNMPAISQYGMGESDVVIRQGELLIGVLDKGHYGPTPFGLVHCSYELYGGGVAGQMLTCFGRLFMNFLQQRGFTLGVEDILVTRKADKARAKIVRNSPKVGGAVARKTLDMEMGTGDREVADALMSAHFTPNQQRMRELDMNMRNQTNDIQNSIVNTCMPNGLLKLFPENNLQLMVVSGAKGSSVNCMQISCLLGQIELEGKRPPLMLSGKTLPSFLAYDVTPRAGGFVTGRFLTGIRQQEYFFHCMAGREGLIDTAVKTSRSGYLQRCLIKHLEGIKVGYDLTVRDSDNSVIQFNYGEDGLDLHKTGFLKPRQLPFLVENQGVISSVQPRCSQDDEAPGKISYLEKKIQKWRKKHGQGEGKKVRTSGFLSFCQLVEPSGEKALKGVPGRKLRDSQLCKMWKGLSNKEREKYGRYQGRCPDPVMSQFSQYLPRVLPEKLDAEIRSFSKQQLSGLGMSESKFWEMMSLKVQRAVVEPGEPVGLLSAQSIGEPSTQMTLNTFHFAGRNEMNVTLGIPRLREVLMVGSRQIKTPAIDVPVVPGGPAKDRARELQKHLTKVHLKELLQDVEVVEWLAIEGRMKHQRRRMFKVTFHFLPWSCYRDKFAVKPDQVIRFLEKVYVKKLLQHIRFTINKQAKRRLMSSGSTKRVVERAPAEDEEPMAEPETEEGQEVLDADDGDDTATGQKRKKDEEQEYEDGEEDGAETGGNTEVQDTEDVVMDEDEEVPSDMEDIDEALIAEYEEKDTDSDSVNHRINTVLQLAGEVAGYKFDTKKKQWAELTLSFPLVDSKLDLLALVESHVQRVVVHEVVGISRCILGEEKGPHGGMEFHLKTEGINMMEMYKHADFIDVNRLYCNSIHHVADTYGIEAANKAIIKEIEAVFAAYGIQVDHRHLSLVADYMTFEGVYKPFNRRALETNPSPLQKMSFESTMGFILSSVINKNVDKLLSPSSQIVVGKNVTTGTGCFELFTPMVVS
ncbi:DNA-directed RNA polymerase I subunit RPA1-like isoform X1 [Mya arenaria]|uniref:DNA-directed RNA polymerase I subunit RPA1-like isoform X1 n=2 Tax=Mya arenaria TaxID=6604 RepID=UPI0022E3EAC7|nr:DNA-directed RNA polymerase I subunit RPA1-like isoform X1 [Mya arenaria]XP_052811235.1 DNA-directed RNA polymerase I subunit RPA1-like isoform X1 [Mya arenaria]